MSAFSKRYTVADLVRDLSELDSFPADARGLGVDAGGEVVTDQRLVDPGTDHNLLMVAGAGRGKTNLLRGIVAQDLAGASSVMVVDSRCSGASFRKLHDLPNLNHAYRVTAIHDLLVCLGEEMEARRALQKAGTPDYMPLTLAVDDLAAVRHQLHRYWVRRMPVGGPVASPALAALDEAVFTGRSVDVRVVATAQTAPSARWVDQFGVRVAANLPRLGWDLVAPELSARPAPSRIPGRMQVMFTGWPVAIETQIPLWTDTAVRELASRSVESTPFPYLAATTWGDHR